MDEHTTNIVLFLIGQSVVIIGALIVAHVRTQVAIAKVTAEVKAVQGTTKELKNDHGNLSEQVGGISRSLARLEGHVNALSPITPIQDKGS